MRARARACASIALLGALASANVRPAAAQRATPPHTDSTATIAAAREEVTRFLRAWRAAWISASGVDWDARGAVGPAANALLAERLGLPDDAPPPASLDEYTRASRERPTDGRAMVTPYARCMTSNRLPWGRLGALSPVVTRIPSAFGARGWCPGWPVSRFALLAPDQRVVVDSALPRASRAAIRARRDTLLRSLEAAAVRVPGDGWLAGQRVRFLVDQRRLGDARRVAEGCAGVRWWCDLLVGYALAMEGDTVGARRVFGAARAGLDPAARCAWDDIGPLLEAPDRRRWDAMPCAARDSLVERFWWLADPLWSDDLEERRLEHETRRVQLLLRRSMPIDERINWENRMGGDAAEQMLLRYGAPSYMAYIARLQGAQDAWLAADGSPPSAPHVTAEYHESRVHLVPAWRVVADPYGARSVDWTLHEPDTLAPRPDTLPACSRRTCAEGWRDLAETWRLDAAQRNEVWPHAVLWWPAEHAEPARPLVQHADPYVAVLRRQDSILVVAAVDVADPSRHPDARLGRTSRASASPRVAVALVASPGPEERRVVARDTVAPVARIRLQAMLPTGPTMLALEARSVAAEGTDARTRFGMRLPPPLREMPPGAIAVSAPVLLDVGEGSGLPADAMRTSTDVERGERVAIYWESYGVAAEDTVDVAVGVTREDAPGLLQRLAMAAGVAGDPRTGVVVRWTEPAARRASAVVATSGVPVLARHVELELTGLEPGRYVLEVRVNRGRDAAASAASRLMVR